MKSAVMKTSLKSAILALTAGAMLLPMAAQATCTQNGPIVRVSNYADQASSTGCYIYMRSSATSAYYYYTTTIDDDMCIAASIAATTAVDTSTQGNATACPTTGTGRYMGTLRYIVINP